MAGASTESPNFAMLSPKSKSARSTNSISKFLPHISSLDFSETRICFDQTICRAELGTGTVVLFIFSTYRWSRRGGGGRIFRIRGHLNWLVLTDQSIDRRWKFVSPAWERTAPRRNTWWAECHSSASWTWGGRTHGETGDDDAFLWRKLIQC